MPTVNSSPHDTKSNRCIDLKKNKKNCQFLHHIIIVDSYRFVASGEAIRVTVRPQNRIDDQQREEHPYSRLSYI